MVKVNLNGDVTLMEVSSQPSLGVRTRAKTLALQRQLQLSTAASPPSKPDWCYLVLRSRRLEKLPLTRQQSSLKTTATAQKQGFVFRENEYPQPEKALSESSLNSIKVSMEDDGCFQRQSGGELGIGETEIEASFGENNLEDMGRSTRESTPCSLITAADTITIPCSSTKQRSCTVVNESAQNAPRRTILIPDHETEGIFAEEEQLKLQQRLFIEKYNFDIVNDLPLPGRYEWVKVMP